MTTRKQLVGQIQRPGQKPEDVRLIVQERRRYDDIQAWLDSGETDIVIPSGTYVVSKRTDFTDDFPNGDQPCLFLKNKTGVTIRGEGLVKFVVETHAQGILELQGCTDVTIENIEFVGPTDFPQIDGTTGYNEKGIPTAGYNTTNAGIWGNNKNNSLDTSANTSGGFSGAFPQYGGGTASTWGTWNGGFIGNSAFGLLIQNGCSNITVRDCKASGFNYVGFGVGHLGDTALAESTDIRFLNCQATGNQGAGIHTMLVDGCVIKNCVLSDNGHPDSDPANDTVVNPGYGYTARGVATYYSKNVLVEGCLVEGNKRKGLDSHASDGLALIGNTIRDCAGMGIGVPWTNSTRPVINTTIKGNLIKNCSWANGSLGAIVSGGAIDGGYSYANSLLNLIISENIIEDCGDTGIEIFNGRNIQITNNIIRGFDDRSSGSTYFMFLGRVSTNEPIYNMNVSGNVCDADGDTSRYRGISVRRARNSQVNHNMIYLDHTSASIGLELSECTTTQSFGNVVYVDSGATSSIPLNLLATDGFTVGNYSDPDVGTLSYPIANEGTTGEQEHRLRVPEMISLDIVFDGTTDFSNGGGYTVLAGEDYVDDVVELATYGFSIDLKNLHTTNRLRAYVTQKSAAGVTTSTGEVNHIYDRGSSSSSYDFGMIQDFGGTPTNIIMSNATGGQISVTIMVF